MNTFDSGSSDRPPVPVKRRKGNLSAITWYFFLAGLFTFPMLFKINYHLDNGTGSFYYQRLWSVWWVKEALYHLHQTPYYSDYIFYPTGMDLSFVPLSELNGVLIWLLQSVFSLVGSYNILILFSLILSAFGAYKLVLYLTDSSKAAFLSGIIFGFTIYKPVDDLALLSSGWIPLAVLYFLRMFDRQRVRYGVLAAIFSVFACLSSWYYLIFLFLFYSIYLMYYMILKTRHIINIRVLLPFCFFCLIYFILILPFAIPFGRQVLMDKTWIIEERADQLAHESLNLSGYRYLECQEKNEEAIQAQGGEGDLYRTKYVFWTVLFGYATLLLALAGLLGRRQKDTFFWLASFVLFLLLSLGHYPVLFDRAFPSIPMPLKIFDRLPIFDVVRRPYVFLTMQSLCLSVLAGFGFCTVSKRKSRGLVFFLSMLIILESFSMPFQMVSPRVPDYVRLLDREEGDFAILEVPIGNCGKDLFWQTVHRKKKVGGCLSQRPGILVPMLEHTPLLRELWRPESIADTERNRFNRAPFLQTLDQYDIAFIIVHKRGFEGFSTGFRKPERANILEERHLIFNPVAFSYVGKGRFFESASPVAGGYLAETVTDFLIFLLGPPELETENFAVFRTGIPSR